MTIYEIPVSTLDGRETTLAEFHGRAMLIVNVASKCRFTPQYEGIEALSRKYRDAGLSVLGFPCNQFLSQEPGDAASIGQFCKLTYDVTFPIFSKIDVNGPNAHPLYRFLKSQKRGLFGTTAIKWNFTKFLVARDGSVAARYGPFRKPASIESRIVAVLGRESPVTRP